MRPKQNKGGIPIKKLLVLSLTLLSAAVFTACDFLMHEHIKGQWEFNDSQHWQSVTCTWHTCNINIVSYDHIDKDENGLCDVCGYENLIDTEADNVQ